MNTQMTCNFCAALAGIVLGLAAANSPAAQYFFTDDFENGLGQWTGKNGGPSHGVTVSDPVNFGHVEVLTFTALNEAGDIYTTSVLSPGSGFVLSFDFLGLPGLGGTPGDLGGFIGISSNLNPNTLGFDEFWLAGTENGYGVVQTLTGDGTWHHYDLTIPSSPLASFHIMIEDFTASGGVAGDVFFDNIAVTAVPEPQISYWIGAAVLVFGRLFASCPRKNAAR